MVIKSLELNNYRNYQLMTMNFHPEINVLYGDNAQGKTNVLEAIYLCSTTRSHKGSKDRDMIRMKEEEAHIRLRLYKNSTEHTIDMHLKKNRAKGIAIDGIPIHKSSELVGLVHIVFFSPEDLNIIKNGPSERRRFLDMELCQLDKLYLYNLTNYNRILSQRNNLLRQISFNLELMDTLEIWDEQLVNYGKLVMERRNQFLEELNPIIRKIHSNLSGKREELSLIYDADCRIETFMDQIARTREKDIYTKMTGTGPHRDDLSFFINGIQIRKFGSQGQQRTAALSLKLAQIEILRQKTNDMPILLLDDVLSELDRNRQNYLMESIKNTQTIVTCTGLEEFVNHNLDISRIFRVVEGTITEEYINL